MHPMRRKDKERDAAFAWQVLRDATYATLAMTDSDGAPYCVPVNHVADEQGNAVYFHCAGAGRKWDILTKEPPVCLSAVSKAELDSRRADHRLQVRPCAGQGRTGAGPGGEAVRPEAAGAGAGPRFHVPGRPLRRTLYAAHHAGKDRPRDRHRQGVLRRLNKQLSA